MIKNSKIAFGVFVVLFMVFWNLLDLIWTAIFSNNSYHFSGGTDLGLPLILAMVIGYALFLRGKSK